MENEKEIVKVLETGIIEQLDNYAKSPHTTNAGAAVRLVVKLLPKRLLINLLHAKLKK
jgi:hypothetical protein